nr:MAG TPA: hypothetical protein [Inoviridae sp.]
MLSLGALIFVASPVFGRLALLSLPLQTDFAGSSSLLTVGKK